MSRQKFRKLNLPFLCDFPLEFVPMNLLFDTNFLPRPAIKSAAEIQLPDDRLLLLRPPISLLLSMVLLVARPYQQLTCPQVSITLVQGRDWHE